MRINKFVALASGLSRRSADVAISANRVMVNGRPPQLGQDITVSDLVTLDGHALQAPGSTTTILLNKPVGYVVSRNGQGAQTIYELLPPEFHQLKPVGRLDRDSSGLLLLTNDGALANQLTHPRYAKQKIYEVTLDKDLSSPDKEQIERGVEVEDYVSRLHVTPLATSKQELGNSIRESGIKNQESRNGQGPLVPNAYFLVTMTQGRNRQIRKTFAALGYTVTSLHRTQFGDYQLSVPTGGFKQLN